MNKTVKKVPVKVADHFNTEIPVKKQEELFGRSINPNLEVPAYEAPTEFTPRRKPHLFDPDSLTDMLTWYFYGGGEPMYVFGQQGCGKSESWYQFAARLNIPVYEMTIFDDMAFDDLIGHYTIQNGETVGVYSVIPRAMGAGTYVPGICLINEMHKASDGVMTGLNEVLEGRSLSLNINNGEVISPHEDFRFVGTGNTNLTEGDAFGLHPSAQVQDAAFIDRFWKTEKGFQKEDVEMEIILMHVPNFNNDIGREVVRKIVKVFHSIREQHISKVGKNDALTTVASTRTAIRYTRMLDLYKGLVQRVPPINIYTYCIERALTATAPMHEKKAIIEKVLAEFEAPKQKKAVNT